MYNKQENNTINNHNIIRQFVISFTNIKLIKNKKIISIKVLNKFSCPGTVIHCSTKSEDEITTTSLFIPGTKINEN